MNNIIIFINNSQDSSCFLLRIHQNSFNSPQRPTAGAGSPIKKRPLDKSGIFFLQAKEIYIMILNRENIYDNTL